MELSREWVFENLLSALSSSDPLESLLIRATQICRGSGLVLNELGEVTRSVGSAPNHLIANWVLGLETTSARPTHDAHETSIGRWVVRSKSVRIRQRDYVFVLAVFGEPGAEDAVRHAAEHAVSGQDRRETDDVHGLGLILDTSAKLLQAFEGFETFSMSTHREESARLMRDLEVGVSPGREPGIWRMLENFGFDSYRPVRIIRASISAIDESAAASVGASGQRRRTPRPTGGMSRSDRRKKPERGIVISDSGHTASAIERTALCVADFDVAEHFSSTDVIGVGISEPFAALSQVPEMLKAADVALATAGSGQLVRVDEMRPSEWAAARMSSRFDQQVVRRFVQKISKGPDVWETLLVYIDCRANVVQTASQLQVHANTVRYRLGLLEHELGARLSDPYVAADLVIALECERLRTNEANSSSWR
ncbi:helix-turn-helix domain-containing protein [Brevibacterium sp. BDJS002]|uniref:PucR C-terminal helix-turn-helix domain-containing protein n=1 Tax=Brevibacterium aurantiacum TaxID=273384 RepID=A0A2H1KRI5_BREAU|nr:MULTISPECIES: PucR family transcriptional regulator [Brevibacterium]MDN5550644.1 helix-turn-helix domain-containing protein [Brevibacterium sp.]AZT95785.1 hypothetical protein CXR27_01275 [Brevibacterium aurantiacum]MDN5587122.1 helix-turn-helix domain-containing protein [Brevibacterium sp.]PCC18461.1 hypothetical protein CIK79_09260 [Brevibacterium aurantiacum]RCS97746.1 hypothetical protein CIK61_01540 [Brevibacterium aurantiacum]